MLSVPLASTTACGKTWSAKVVSLALTTTELQVAPPSWVAAQRMFACRGADPFQVCHATYTEPANGPFVQSAATEKMSNMRKNEPGIGEGTLLKLETKMSVPQVAPPSLEWSTMTSNRPRSAHMTQSSLFAP